MAEVKVSERVPVSIDRAWALASDLSRLGEWLSLHEGWRGELPAELTVGAELSGVVRAKGLRNRITWTVDAVDAPRHLSLHGEGKGGTKVRLALDVRADGDGSVFDFRCEFAHPMLRGPMGSIAAKTVKGDLQASVKRFAELA